MKEQIFFERRGYSQKVLKQISISVTVFQYFFMRVYSLESIYIQI